MSQCSKSSAAESFAALSYGIGLGRHRGGPLPGRVFPYFVDDDRDYRNEDHHTDYVEIAVWLAGVLVVIRHHDQSR